MVYPIGKCVYIIIYAVFFITYKKSKNNKKQEMDGNGVFLYSRKKQVQCVFLYKKKPSPSHVAQPTGSHDSVPWRTPVGEV